jgi:hypothetical protein
LENEKINGMKIKKQHEGIEGEMGWSKTFMEGSSVLAREKEFTIPHFMQIWKL